MDNNSEKINEQLNVEQTKSGTVEQRTRIDDHHHSSHKHHSKAYYRYRLIRHKIKKFFRAKKYRKYVFVLLIVVIAAAAIFAGTRNNTDKRIADNTKSHAQIEEDVEDSLSFVDIKFPYFSNDVVLSCPYVSNYMSGDDVKTISDYKGKISAGDRLDRGEPVVFKYETVNLPVDIKVKSSKLTLYPKGEPDNKTDYSFDSQKLEIYNLKTNSEYEYKIEIILSDGSVQTSSGTFKTTQTPRFINIDGAVNVRDIGGWRTDDNKVIKQGMIYRGSEIDARQVKDFAISENGVDTMRNTLGIKSDFDLRNKDEGLPKYSPIGKDIKHNVYSIYEYNLSDTSNVKETYKKLFSDLAKSKNYPVYLHCTYGIDRTGTVSFMLEALLGMSEENLIREYELSGLYYTDLNPRDKNSNFNKFLNDFKSLDGSTMQEKAENYLISCGVTENEISNIKNLLTEEN